MQTVQEGRVNKLARRRAFLVVVLIAALAAGFVAQQVVAHRSFPFDSDEASHANGGLALFLELQTGDAGGFVREFYNQSFYPPGVSWILALLYAAVGVSPLAARLFSTLSFFLALLVMYGLSLELDEEKGWLVGLVAVSLTALSPAILLNSALAMMELPGLLVTLVFLWAYVRLIKRPSRRRFLLTSFLLAATFLTKYTFGVMTTTAVILFEASIFINDWTSQRKNVFSLFTHYLKTRWLWLFGVYGLVLLVWLGRADKLTGFFGFSRPLADTEPWPSTENWLFYLRSLALHYAPAPLFVLFTGAAVLWAVAHWRNLPVRLLLLYFVSGMALIILVNHPTNSRFIATVAPIAHVLTGVLAGRLLMRWLTKRNIWLATLLLAVGLIVLLSGPAVFARLGAYSSILDVAYESDAGTTAVATWIDAQIPDGDTFYLVNYWDQFSPQIMAWHLGRQNDSSVRFSDLMMPAALLEPASPQTLAAFRRDLAASGASYLVVIEGGPWGASFWPDYTADLAGNLAPVAREKFTIVRYGGYNWLERSVFSATEWAAVSADNFKTFEIQVLVFKIDPPLVAE